MKNLKKNLYEKYIKLFCLAPKEENPAPLITLYTFVKSFVDPFNDFASDFFVNSFSSFSATPCFVLFQLTLLLKPKSL